MTHPPAAAACRQVLPKSSGVSMSNPVKICDQHHLGCQRGDSGDTNGVSMNVPEDSSFLQQSEKPLRAARCRGNIPWMPLLKTFKTEKASPHRRVKCESVDAFLMTDILVYLELKIFIPEIVPFPFCFLYSVRRQTNGYMSFVTNLAMSAPCLMSAVTMSSWP